MTVQQSGRRERKKAATRQKIADTALRLFLERGYDAVGIRDVAAEADVAVTTLFSHFASKEALVFEQDEDFEHRLTRAVTDRAPHEPLIPALRREILALVRHCTADSAAPIWRMIDASPPCGSTTNRSACATRRPWPRPSPPTPPAPGAKPPPAPSRGS